MPYTRHKILIALGAASLIGALLIGSAAASGDVVVSQKKRAYAPSALTLKAGQSLTILNDDIFVHNVLVEHEKMAYDSGVMDEGESRKLWFEDPGNYEILCAIHPKMKLSVSVE